MPTIHVLPENLANRIAAGEVVERPASVVKELVENAIDAGATRVEVELRGGGRDLIRVTDNGCGMTPDDLSMAVQRFATSKVADVEDLERILTMGFRGEALPSIGAVAQLRITTRPVAMDEGSTLVVEGGVVRGPERTGCPPGTVVEVARLFYNTPARLKFLATTATERGHCVAWVQYLALSRPDIAFRLVHDGQVLFATPGSGELAAVVATIYGSAAARDFIPVQAETEAVSLHGLISGPRLTRATRHYQHFFVNRRFVRSRQLSHALTEAYGLLLPPGKSPVCAVHLTLAPEHVDPNVHPTKIEVRFRHPHVVHTVLQQACEEALAAAGFRALTQRPPRTSPVSPPAAGVFAGPDLEQQRRAERLRVNPFAESLDEREDGVEVFAPPPDRGTSATPLFVAHEEAADSPEVLGQLANRYIVARSGHDLLLVDQHRAAERVLLHALEASAGRLVRQLLAVPLSLELTPAEAAAVEDHRQALAALGFELEAFGPSASLLRSIPAALVGEDYETAVRDLISDLVAWEAPSSAERRQEQLRAMVACHGATKKNCALTREEMQRLIRDLMATDAPAVCPHGDPIIVSFPLSLLDRRFRR
ncbi:MAG: DNA mismatch repair endonuclease MutL [Armatimonadetes bacterium]|nr:DNA mismatch repair endonuclease MutL [Armatimonadota bacterium]